MKLKIPRNTENNNIKMFKTFFPVKGLLSV